MFAVASPADSERIREFIETPDFPFEILATQVHYTEYLRSTAPCRATAGRPVASPPPPTRLAR